MRAWLAASGSELAEQKTEAAQQHIYDAWDTDDEYRQHQLAIRALRRSALCADAFNLLGALHPEHAIEMFTRGMVAGALALGPDRFAELEGEFWGFLETRPYMRARAGLAAELQQAGRTGEAIAHWRELLRLSPNDNLGVRYLLAFELLALGDKPALRALLKAHRDDGGTVFQYTRALLAITAGNKGADGAALEAFEANPHVPELLASTASLVWQEAPHMTLGGLDEAVYYVHHAGDAWRNTPGAINRLMRACAAPAREQRMILARVRVGMIDLPD
jgi:tetratricopeptide (TPR) repeat protein